MITLLMRRHVPLSMKEIGRLPSGSVAVQGEGDVVARATVDLPLSRLLKLACAMGQVVPDGRLDVEEGTARSPGAPPALPVTGQGPPPPPRAPELSGTPPRPAELDEGRPPEGSPWALVESGEIEAALAQLADEGLDADGRDRVRLMLRSTDPKTLALGCRISMVANWRSAVQLIRRMVAHGDTDVRRYAAEALGALSGPVMVPVLRPLLGDPSPEVREAARVAIGRIEGG